MLSRLSDFAVYITSLYVWRDGTYISGLEHCEAETQYVNSSDGINTILQSLNIDTLVYGTVNIDTLVYGTVNIDTLVYGTVNIDTLVYGTVLKHSSEVLT